MGRRINVILSEDAHRELVREVPRGDRSRILEAALGQYLRKRRRSVAFRRLETLREKSAAVPLRDVVAQLRRDRGRA